MHRGQTALPRSWTRDLDDVFAVQDEITDVIAATVTGRIEEAGRRHAESK
jgi:TolB-like protein